METGFSLTLSKTPEDSPVHEKMVLVVHAQKLHFYTHSDVSGGARSVMFSQSFPLHTYFVYARSEGSGEAVRMHRLV